MDTFANGENEGDQALEVDEQHPTKRRKAAELDTRALGEVDWRVARAPYRSMTSATTARVAHI
jgi:hypothetical protein